MSPHYIKHIIAKSYEQYSRYGVMFMFFFFFVCSFIHFGHKGVANPWLIDASWYFAVMVPALLLTPIAQAFIAYKKK